MSHPFRLRRAALGALIALAAVPALAQRAPATPDAALAALSDGVAFVENRGQWPDEVLFRARLGGADAWVTADGVVFDFYSVEREGPEAGAPRHEEPGAVRRRGHVVAMRFEGASAPRAAGHGRQAAYHNYFLGGDPARWASRVPLYDEVVLEGLYAGVDLRLYSEEGLLRYDLVVAPGADPAQIRMRLVGADGVSLAADGALAMATALGPVEQRGLLAYQEGADGRRQAVASAFRLDADGSVRFAVGTHDRSRALVLDPLIWATFLGGSNDEYPGAVTVAAEGEVIVAGETESPDFPVTPGAYDISYNDGGPFGGDAFISRLSSDGSTLVYSTFLGGSEGDDIAHDVAVGDDGSVTVVGETLNSDFPVTPGAFDTSNDGVDAFVTRLSPDGASLAYSTFLGGASYDRAWAVDVSAGGGATVAGVTYSSDFPSTAGAFDPSYNGDEDAFVVRLSADGSALLYGSFLGGTDSDGAYDVAVGADGGAAVAGYTSSTGFPATPGAYDTSYNGGGAQILGIGDAFVARLSADGSALVYATFLGASESELAFGVGVGSDGSVTATGPTYSPGFPVTPGAYDTSYNGVGCCGGDVFVARLSPDGAALAYATFVGGANAEWPTGVVLGTDGSASIAGWTESADFPTTPGAHDPTFNGAFTYDAFVARLSGDGSALLYSTFLGGTADEFGTAIARAGGGVIVVGSTVSEDFPTTAGAFDTSYNGGTWYQGGDGFIAHLDVGLPPPSLQFTAAALNSPVPRGDRLRFRVTLTNVGEDPLSGALRLDVVTPGGDAFTRTRSFARALAPGETATPTFALPIPAGAPLGTYGATVTALEGGTMPLGSAAFSFEVVAGSALAGSGAEAGTGEGAAWAVDLLGDGTPGTATADAAAEGALSVRPNPARDRATLAFTLAAPAEARVTLYDVLGREVAAVEAGELAAGAHRLGLDVSALPAGVYVWRLVAGARTEAGRLTVAR